jgi:polar amino acid transport system substrate-binding protein
MLTKCNCISLRKIFRLAFILLFAIWQQFAPQFTLAASGMTAAAATPQDLAFVTEEFPPLNFSNNGQADGFGSDVVREILRREKLTAPLTVFPWARSYKLAQIQPNVGLYCLVRSIEREKLFQWIGPIGNIESKLYVNRDSALHIESLTDARNVNAVIALREGYSAQLLQRLGFKNMMPVTNATEAVRLMRVSGEKSLLLMTSNALPEAMNKTATPSDAFRPVMTVMKTQVYIGFSLSTSPELVDRFQRTLDQMKVDGSFTAIYQKWFPGEKPPGLRREADILPAN